MLRRPLNAAALTSGLVGLAQTVQPAGARAIPDAPGSTESGSAVVGFGHYAHRVSQAKPAATQVNLIRRGERSLRGDFREMFGSEGFPAIRIAVPRETFDHRSWRAPAEGLKRYPFP